MDSDQRHDQIVESARLIIEDVGVLGCSMTAVADRSGISRVWLYKHFSEIESILIDVWLSWQIPQLRDAQRIGSQRDVLLQENLLSRLDTWLDMPLGAAIVGNFALIGTEGGAVNSSRLNDMMWEDWQDRWIGPMAAGGIARDVAVRTVTVVHSSVVAVVLAMRQSRLQREGAKAVLSQVIKGVVDPTWKIALPRLFD
jgi:AcrR family transcriptional regulator